MCAWCGKDMGTVPSEGQSENLITHGICIGCADKVYLEMEKDLRSFLDGLAAPVVVVNETGSVETANKRAQMFLGKDLSGLEGYKGGDVFECAYAKLPEGCGNTIHCSGCTIRRTIMDTFQSGKGHLRTPAVLNRATPADPEKIDFLISTEKVGGVVLLRIDDAVDSEGP